MDNQHSKVIRREMCSAAPTGWKSLMLWLVTLVTITGLNTQAAKAQMHVCNDTGAQFNIAMGWRENGEWMSKGWFDFAPGECAITLPQPLKSRYYYYYAISKSGDLVSQGGNDSGFFCTSSRAFRYKLQRPCKGHDFRIIDIGTSDGVYTLNLTEKRTGPQEAALRCADRMSKGRDAFVSCWIEGMASAKQRRILACWDKTKSFQSFAVCAGNDQLDPQVKKVADCVSKVGAQSGMALVGCVAGSKLNPAQRTLLDCATRKSITSCVVGSQLTPEQSRLYNCLVTNKGYTAQGICAAGEYMTSEQQRLAQCIVEGRGNYTKMATCAASNGLTSEQQTFVQCAISSNGQPYIFAGCVGTTLTINELQKCLDYGIGGNGCFGTNNTAAKFIKNAWKDVTKGAGRNNDARKFVENTIEGPRRDILRGDVGRSDKSVWRQVGLPRIKFKTPW